MMPRFCPGSTVSTITRIDVLQNPTTEKGSGTGPEVVSVPESCPPRTPDNDAAFYEDTADPSEVSPWLVFTGILPPPGNLESRFTLLLRQGSFQLFLLFLMVYFWVRASLVPDVFWFSMTIVLDCFICIINSLILCHNQPQVKKFPLRVYHGNKKWNPGHRRKAHALIWLYCIGDFFAYFYFIACVVNREFIENTFFFTDDTGQTHHNLLVAIVLVLWLCYFAAVRATNMYIVSLISAFCTSLVTDMKDIERLVMTRLHSQVVSSEVVKTMRETYTDLRRRVHAVDDMFSRVTLLLYGLVIMHTCIHVTSFFSDHKEYTQSLIGNIMYTFDIAYIWTIFVGVSLSGASVAEQGVTLSEVIVSAKVLQVTDSDAYPEMQQLMMQTSLHPISLSAWKFFAIGRSTILSVMSVLMTYAVLTVQIHPTAIEQMSSDKSSDKYD